MPIEPKPTDLGPDLFGQPIPRPDPAAVADDEADTVNQDGGLTLNADEWLDLEEVWDQPIGFEEMKGQPARPVPYPRPGFDQAGTPRAADPATDPDPASDPD